MLGFLDEVAARLYQKYGSELSSLKLIFPSRRSRIFFTESLSRVASEPLWQPAWQSLDDLVIEATPLRHGESVRLIAELYQIYSTYHNESFDKFYFWGEILLSDFDMIDKYLVDADMLFANVADLKLLESDISYMTPEQLKIIAFWSSIQDGNKLSQAKEQFLKVWESLPKIYHQLRKRLTELGIGYTGMIQRSAVERIKAGEFSFDETNRYAVVGFNALSECEKYLFDSLSRHCSVDFFWDYDNYYTSQQQQEAGLFIRQNLERYHSQAEISHDNFARDKKFEVVAAASNVLQCKYASKIISQIIEKSGGADKDTAIVLTDENLLTPLLYALPAAAGKVNVTMGYPLKQSLSYSLIERLLSLQSNLKGRESASPQFYYVDTLGLLAHPYVSEIDKELFESIGSQINLERLISVDRSLLVDSKPDFMARLFKVCSTWQEYSEYLREVISLVATYPYQGEDSMRRLEFLATISQSIATLHNSLTECNIELKPTIYLSLLRRMLNTLRVPFEGEPLEGLQVMGILETRNLDFSNVIILSMNDDNFPGNRLTTPSYVPYNIRAAYGVPTPEHHEGVFAYYFYRLIQRAQNVWMVYCSHADDKTTGEASRYIYQLDYESPFSLSHIDVGVDVNIYEQQEIEVAKVGQIDKLLSRYTDPDNPLPISPSAINRYVACPMRFYFQHIAQIKGDNSISEDVDNSMFGNILHEAINCIYGQLIGTKDILPQLEAWRADTAQIESEVVAAIRKVCQIKPTVKESNFAGDLVLIKDIVVKYIAEGVMTYDSHNSEFRVIGTEQKHRYQLPLSGGRSITIEGTLDRVDRLQSGRVRVVDYKTGGKHLEFKSIASLFEGEGKERQGHIIQTLTYSMILHHSLGESVVPSLYYVRFMHDDSYSPLLQDKSCSDSAIATYQEKRREFEEQLTNALEELLDRSQPFRQASDKEGTCTFCDFRAICRI